LFSVKPLDDRQGKGSCFPCPGLGAPEKVTSFKKTGNGGFLNGSRICISLFPDGALNLFDKV
jgi:hypothetical protein